MFSYGNGRELYTLLSWILVTSYVCVQFEINYLPIYNSTYPDKTPVPRSNFRKCTKHIYGSIPMICHMSNMFLMISNRLIVS